MQRHKLSARYTSSSTRRNLKRRRRDMLKFSARWSGNWKRNLCRKFTKKSGKGILGGFYGFRADRTPPEPMNLLCISMVWGAFVLPGARRGALSTFYVEITKISKGRDYFEVPWDLKENHGNDGFYGNSWSC